MSDPLTRVTKGQPRRYTARTHNEILEAVRKFRDSQSLGVDARIQAAENGLAILVRNDTGGTLAEWSTVRVAGLLSDLDEPAVVSARPIYSGALPASESDVIAVIQSGAADGGIARATFQGHAVARVNVTDEGHRFAVPIVGDSDNLASAVDGPVRILAKPSGTGVKVCAILLGGVGGGDSDTYLLAADSTPDEDGRFTSNEDTYDPDTDTWTTSKADVLGEPAIGITMQKGLRYPARPTSDPGVYTTIADANEIEVESVPVYFGGLVNTGPQYFKGPKTHRDYHLWKSHGAARSQQVYSNEKYTGIQVQGELAGDSSSNRLYPMYGITSQPDGQTRLHQSGVKHLGGSDYSRGEIVTITGPNASIQASASHPSGTSRFGVTAFEGEAGLYATLNGNIVNLTAATFPNMTLSPGGSIYGVNNGELQTNTMFRTWAAFGTYRDGGTSKYTGVDAKYDPTGGTGGFGLLISGGAVVGIYALDDPDPPDAPSPPDEELPEFDPWEPIYTFDCADGDCVYVEGLGGTYATLAECQAVGACSQAGYYCFGVGCMYSSVYPGGSGDFNGPYGTPEECEAACPLIPEDKAWYQVCPIGGVGSAACEYLTEDEATARGITAGPFETETACDEAFPAICSE